MRPLVCCSFLLFITAIVNAQSKFTIGDDLSYAIIKDTDGYVNIRKAPNVKAEVVGKINDYRIFNCEPNKTNWWKVLQVDEHDKSYWLEGYIYKDRVSLLKGWKVIKSKNAHLDSGIFKTDSLVVVIKRKTFNREKHRLIYSKGDPNYRTKSELEKIDGKLYWGTDGEIPKKVISSVKVIKNGITIQLPKTTFEDLYEPNFDSISVCNGPENTFYVSMLNSDGAGAYYIIWILKDNKYLNRYIDDSED